MGKIQAVEPLKGTRRDLESSDFSLEILRLKRAQQTAPAQFLAVPTKNNRFSWNLLSYMQNISSDAIRPVFLITERVTRQRTSMALL
jgi:hypothetical protein